MKDFVAGGEQQAHRKVQALLGAVDYVHPVRTDRHGVVFAEPGCEGLAQGRNSRVGRVVRFVAVQACHPCVQDVAGDREAGFADAEHDRARRDPRGFGDFADLVDRDVADVCGKLGHVSHPSGPRQWCGCRCSRCSAPDEQCRRCVFGAEIPVLMTEQALGQTTFGGYHYAAGASQRFVHLTLTVEDLLGRQN